MESNINLLPEKDKQLKRESKPRATQIEMTEPKDRVFSERIIRSDGLVEFFKKIFKRKPALPIAKPKKAEPAEAKRMILTPAAPIGPVTKIEAMSAKLPSPPSAIKPIAELKPTQAKVSFFHKVLNRIEGIPEKSASQSNLQQPIKKTEIPIRSNIPFSQNQPTQKSVLPVPPEPVKRTSWTPPPPASNVNPPIKSVAESKPVSTLPPPPKPVLPEIPSFIPDQKPKEEVKEEISQPEALMGNGLNVNLVPEDLQPKIGPKFRLRFILFIASPIVLIVLVSVGLWFYTKQVNNKIAKIDQEEQVVNAQIESYQTGTIKYAQALQQKTGQINQILDQHVYWDEFFKQLEAVTLPTVHYENITADIGGAVSITASTNSFDEVGRQLLTYQQATNFINSVTITSAASATTSTPTETTPNGQNAETSPDEVVNFNVSLRINSKVFYQTAK